MKREIKFRAWDTVEKYMVYQASGETFMFSRLNWSVCLWDFETDEARTTKPSEAYTGIMQYTGLKDKNGKEIYEGDVMQEHNHVGDVRYGIYPRPGFHVWCDGSPLDIWPGSNKYPDKTTWQIIGNIYENPHLLTEKQRYAARHIQTQSRIEGEARSGGKTYLPHR